MHLFIYVLSIYYLYVMSLSVCLCSVIHRQTIKFIARLLARCLPTINYYICVLILPYINALILLHVSSYHYMCPHTTKYAYLRAALSLTPAG